MKEVNSLSRQGVEEQHKKNGNKEIHLETQLKIEGRISIATEKFSVATIKDRELLNSIATK